MIIWKTNPLVSKLDFIKNKYSVSVIILLALLGADILLHKGMGRVMIPEDFTEKITPYQLPVCANVLQQKEKDWIKAVNSIELMNSIPENCNGIEADVYFDTSSRSFAVYHDSGAIATLGADSLLSAYANRKLQANIWLDFKNLAGFNATYALEELNRLRNKYGLKEKIIVESSSAANLKVFCDSGYFTSYYVPFFNPYELEENDQIGFIDSIHHELLKTPASAISGYYFQYPILKKFFPNYPILTWVDRGGASLVSYFFNRQLKNDPNIKVVLFPAE